MTLHTYAKSDGTVAAAASGVRPAGAHALRAPAPGPATTLVCVPYAGGSAAAFRPWRDWLRPRVSVVTVELPGHGTRLRVPPVERMDPLVDDLLCELDPVTGGRYALFGHGSGALIAYELSRRLALQDRPPSHLFVSASRAPDRRVPPPARRSPAADGDSAGSLEQAFDADLRLAGAYSADPLPLDLPITVFGGVDDPDVSGDELDAWGRHTVHACAPRMMPGGRYYLHHHGRLLAAAVGRILVGVAGAGAGKMSPGPVPGSPFGAPVR